MKTEIKTRSDVEVAIINNSIIVLEQYFSLNNESLIEKIAELILEKAKKISTHKLEDYEDQRDYIKVLMDCHSALMELEQTAETTI